MMKVLLLAASLALAAAVAVAETRPQPRPAALLDSTPPLAAPAYLRADADIPLETGTVIRQHRVSEPDEVDRLFRGTT